jgi:hypothetical protein
MFDWLKRIFEVKPSEDLDEKKKQDDGSTPLIIPTAKASTEDADACDGGDGGGDDGS